MTSTVARENALTLARALGIEPPHAERLLAARVLVTASSRPCDVECGQLTESLLSRTFAAAGDHDIALEVVVGDATQRSSAPAVFVNLAGPVATVDRVRSRYGASLDSPAILTTIAACYAAGAAARALLGDGIAPARYPIRIDLRSLLDDEIRSIATPIVVGDAVLVGAGAIGNAFLLGLSCFDVQGTIRVVDPDVVSQGNLNRCHFFRPDDVGQPKVIALCQHVAKLLPNVRLLPFEGRLQEAPGKDRVERLIVAVDSRRARREIQEEIPREVFDASTTGIREVVLHFNDRRVRAACMSCIYKLEPVEEAHERHVATALGVTLEDVRNKYIDADAAERIRAKYPAVTSRIEGEAYDSLFKALCGQQLLHTPGGEQVIAPFGFVSVLAGALLALEFVRRVAQGNAAFPFNYWRLSPWTEPVLPLRQMRHSIDGCSFCGSPVIQDVANTLWDIHG